MTRQKSSITKRNQAESPKVEASLAAGAGATTDTTAVGIRAKATQGGPRIGDPCTGGAKKFPIFDCKGERICVGDTVRAEGLVGSHGQTRTFEMVIPSGHWDQCSISSPDDSRLHINTEYDRKSNRLVCNHVHDDFEHGHHTWAEVIKKADPSLAGQPYEAPHREVPATFPDSIHHWGRADRRLVTPAEMPGFSPVQRQLLQMLIEANHVRYLHSEATRGYPCLTGNVTDQMVRRGRSAEDAERTFMKRWGTKSQQTLEDNGCVYKRHPLEAAFIDYKQGKG